MLRCRPVYWVLARNFLMDLPQCGQRQSLVWISAGSEPRTFIRPRSQFLVGYVISSSKGQMAKIRKRKRFLFYGALANFSNRIFWADTFLSDSHCRARYHTLPVVQCAARKMSLSTRYPLSLAISAHATECKWKNLPCARAMTCYIVCIETKILSKSVISLSN